MTPQNRPRPTSRVPQAPQVPERKPTGKTPSARPPTGRLPSQRPGTSHIPQQHATGRSPTSGRGVVSARKSNTPLIVGGAAGGALLLIIIIAVAASGPKRDNGESNARKPAAAKPIDVAGLENEGKAKCEEGLALIQRCEGMMSGRTLSAPEKAKLKADLDRGIKLISDGMNRLDEANQKSGNMYSTTMYTNAAKAARMKVGELGSAR